MCICGTLGCTFLVRLEIWFWRVTPPKFKTKKFGPPIVLCKISTVEICQKEFIRTAKTLAVKPSFATAGPIFQPSIFHYYVSFREGNLGGYVPLVNLEFFEGLSAQLPQEECCHRVYVEQHSIQVKQERKKKHGELYVIHMIIKKLKPLERFQEKR